MIMPTGRKRLLYNLDKNRFTSIGSGRLRRPDSFMFKNKIKIKATSNKRQAATNCRMAFCHLDTGSRLQASSDKRVTILIVLIYMHYDSLFLDRHTDRAMRSGMEPVVSSTDKMSGNGWNPRPQAKPFIFPKFLKIQ